MKRVSNNKFFLLKKKQTTTTKATRRYLLHKNGYNKTMWKILSIGAWQDESSVFNLFSLHSIRCIFLCYNFVIGLIRKPNSLNQDAERSWLCYVMLLHISQPLSNLLLDQCRTINTCPTKQSNIPPLESWKGATSKSTCTATATATSAAALRRCSHPYIHQMEPEGDYLNPTQVFIKLPLWPLLHDER